MCKNGIIQYFNFYGEETFGTAIQHEKTTIQDQANTKWKSFEEITTKWRFLCETSWDRGILLVIYALRVVCCAVAVLAAKITNKCQQQQTSGCAMHVHTVHIRPKMHIDRTKSVQTVEAKMYNLLNFCSAYYASIDYDALCAGTEIATNQQSWAKKANRVCGTETGGGKLRQREIYVKLPGMLSVVKTDM